MKLLYGLFLRILLGLLATMGLIRVLEIEKSPAALVGLTLVATAAVYLAGWLRPRDGKLAPRGGQANGESAREDLPS